MIRLFIENYEIDLTKEVQFAITKQFEDITNPTTIINEWSKTVEIPFTANNNYVFGCIYHPDRVTDTTYSNRNYFIYFNPLKKMSFRLMYDDYVLMEGYGKMNSVTQKNGTGTYNITLFGELGKLFQEMKKISFDETIVDEGYGDYWIDGSDYFEDVLNKTTVKDSWESAGQSSPLLIGDYTNYVGFAPNNSFDSEFDYKTFQKDIIASDTFENALELNGFTEETGVEPSTAIPDGLLPREIGEYRSYLQLPFVYFNKLFKIFQAKAEEITGYNFVLDNSWFTTTNPYWFKLVYMLKKMDVANGNSYFNQYSDIRNGSSTNLASWIYLTSMNYTEPFSGNVYMRTIVEEQKPVVTNYNKININYPMIFNVKLNTRFNTGVSSGKYINNNNGLLFTMNVTGENGHVESQSYLIVNSGYTGGTYSGATIIRTATATTANIEVPTMDFYFNLDSNTYGSYAKATYTLNWIQNSYPFQPSSSQVSFYYDIVSSTTASIKINGEHWARSGAKFTLNTLWNNEYNLFEEILRYCKIYRIGIFVDNYAKTITFMPLAKFFSNYTIADWSNLVDYSKDYTIKPISFDSKYVMFNYDDSDTKLGKQYKEQYGVNYGELKLITEYNFDENKNNLFEGVKDSIINTDNVLSWTNLYSNKKIVYTLPAEKYVCCQDKEKKNVDCFGQYYFHNGLAEFDDDSQLRGVRISDDTSLQQYNDTYFYSQSTNSVSVDTYPNLSLVYGSNLCLFNTPNENYTYNSSEYTSKNSIFSQFWKNYLDERYNINNKVLTCYIFIPPTEYSRFKFNQFVKIENQLYMVNKIYDYDITSSDSTKVDLITVQDITKYMDVINWL